MRKVLYLAAHGGFAAEHVPLGGGAAIAEQLTVEWARTRPFEVELVGPAVLGASAPSARELVSWGERDYARFCHAFREATTARALKEDPRAAALLVNDLAEGPDFARLKQAGFHIVTIYHVDVVAYIAAIYLRGWLSPAALARAWERVHGLAARLAPRILTLIFEQQRASLLYSDRVVVPSSQMKRLLLAGYPQTPPERIVVLPWGCRAPEGIEEQVEQEARAIRAGHGVPEDAFVLLCLSRISPEKGQDLLLAALEQWERAPDFPARPVHLFICGEPAFMRGRGHLEKLRRRASRLRRVRVHWPGHVTGWRKRGFFRASDVYVFPSRHESYGLTLAEALAEGLPSIALDHAGAREVLGGGAGLLVESPAALRAALARLAGDEDLRRELTRRARSWAGAHPFSESAAALARIASGGNQRRSDVL
jgi:glycosyltransferase involved in cell wall biosynthesis